MQQLTQYHEEVRSTIISIVKERLGIDIKVNVSVTDFGISMYITRLFSDKKIRVSDHSVENFNRIFNEEHYDIGTVLNQLDSLVRDVEMMYFPERFEYVTETRIEDYYTHNIFKSRNDFNAKVRNATIIEEREFLNKKGEPRIEIKFKYPRQRQFTFLKKKSA